MFRLIFSFFIALYLFYLFQGYFQGSSEYEEVVQRVALALPKKKEVAQERQAVTKQLLSKKGENRLQWRAYTDRSQVVLKPDHKGNFEVVETWDGVSGEMYDSEKEKITYLEAKRALLNVTEKVLYAYEVLMHHRNEEGELLAQGEAEQANITLSDTPKVRLKKIRADVIRRNML